jgi:phospholipid/cholesterol/gamma-HCH transport system substrate-binding protein
MANKEKSPQDSQNRNKRIKVALLCISAVLIFVIGANFLKGINIFHKKTYYYCVMDNATNIQQNTAVMLAGYKIGQVQSTKLISTCPPRICATIMLSEKVDIPNDSRFESMSPGLLSSQVLSLEMGVSRTFYHNGDTLPFSVKAGMLDGIDEMKGQISNVLASVDTIGMELKDILHKEGGGEDLKGILANVEDATAHLNNILGQNETKVGHLVTSLERFGKTLDEASPQLTNILDNFDKISDTIAKADIAAVITNANKTIKEVETLVAKVNSGEGTVGNLVSDDAIAKKVDDTVNSLNELLKDLKAHPKRYVHFSLFGKKDKADKK